MWLGEEDSKWMVGRGDLEKEVIMLESDRVELRDWSKGVVCGLTARRLVMSNRRFCFTCTMGLDDPEGQPQNQG